MSIPSPVVVGVLALQGGFAEHIALLRKASSSLSTSLSPSSPSPSPSFEFLAVRTPSELARCHALVIPGGESSTISLLARRSPGFFEALRDFVTVRQRPTWGTCAGLIFLAQQVSDAKEGGQETLGALAIRVHRNHFGRQRESFVTDLVCPFLNETGEAKGIEEQDVASKPAVTFPAVFIRAPVVEAILPDQHDTAHDPVRVLARVRRGSTSNKSTESTKPTESTSTSTATSPSPTTPGSSSGDVVAVQQGSIFGTSFHPELTNDERIHKWWLQQVLHHVKSEGD